MHIIKVGLNHREAPLNVRETLIFSEEAACKAMVHLNNQQAVLENVILSTCNRTEIYAVVDQLSQGIEQLKAFFRYWFQIDEDQLKPYLHSQHDEEVIVHLFRLATGLDSQILGETQILGQVRDAFLTAQRLKTTGKLFNELFKRVITFAKRAHRDTAIGEQAVSISYAAVELAKKVFKRLDDKRIVILGAGEMGELALQNFHGSGATNIAIVNRNLENAQQLAQTFNAASFSMDHLLDVLTDADILIGSTAAPNAILSKDMFQPVHNERGKRPLLIVDIAIPRDIQPNIGELDDIWLYDIDDLDDVVDQNLAARKEAAQLIEQQITHELASFYNWVQTLDAVPVIKALQEKSISIQEQTLESIFRKIPDLNEREMKVLRKHTKSIVNQLLKEPIKYAKTTAATQTAEESLATFADIFGLDVPKRSKQCIHNNH
ncbi:MAG TPA: glutamyl-tRNA reductase [Bacillota bacterium]|nr:glutamyl-tRNA reductase [Bacillota bacterium]